MSESLPPMVCLDGSEIRRIRELKKLTQLYVAKVVGVTTDSISRWENNRYPSVKRENAVRLAEALEVPVADILEKGTGECGANENGDELLDEKTSRTDKRTWRSIIPLILLLSVAGALFFFFRNGDSSTPFIGATRILPPFAAPGCIIPVQLAIESDLDNHGFILREHFPKGWELIESSPPPSSLDNIEGMARWIIKSGEDRHRISYLLKVGPSGGKEEEKFRGELVSKTGERDSSASVGGVSSLRIAFIHWADTNGDHVLDDGEMLRATDLFEEMQDVHLDWNLLETLWDASRYEWDATKGKFRPIKTLRPESS